VDLTAGAAAMAESRKSALSCVNAKGRGANLSTDKLTFGPFELYPDRRLLLEDGRPTRLGSRALDILVALAQRPGEIVGKGELIASVWPDTVVEEANLRVHVAALRKLLGDGRNGARFIENVPGRGYCFVAPVGRTEAQSPPDPGASAPARASTLPAALTRIIGREPDVRALTARAPRRRLVTIVGPGGIGKTTLALVAAERLAPAYRDGVVFVDLALLGDAALLPSALASAFGMPTRTEDATVALAAYLQDKAMLVVLDSCEHLVEATTKLAELLLRAAPGLDVMVTSTERLRAEGEWVHRLSPLAVPAPSREISAVEALRSPAVQMFVDRAAATIGGFNLVDAQAAAVCEICRRLDGMPLAIELAAGRADTFEPRELAALLDDRFRVLNRGRRTAMPRHRTLRAMLDWSYGLLSRPEQRVLRRLAVFNGGFGLTAASAVVGDADGLDAIAIEDCLMSLVAKSLVATESGDADTQYRLLDTTRAYAREELATAGEHAPYARRHAEHFRAVFERAEAEWDTRPTEEWLAAIVRQLGNLRSALDWAFAPEGARNGELAIGVALTVAAVPVWCQLSLVDEGLRHVERALAVIEAEPGDDRRRTRLLAALGWLQMYATTGVDRSAAAWRAALTGAARLGDTDYQLRATWALWADRQNHGAFRESLDLARRFQALAADAADPADRLVADRMLGASLHFLGEQTEARAQIERFLVGYSAPQRRSHAVRFQFDQRVTARITLARILWVQGFADQAMRDVETNVADAAALGHGLSLCNALAQAACPIALLVGDLDAAERFTAMLRRGTAEQALDVWRAYADCFDGEIMIRRGRHTAGLRLLEPALDELRRANFVQYRTAFLAALAHGLTVAGQLGEARAAVGEALTQCERTGECWSLSELLRLQAEIVLLLGEPDAATEAEASFQRSLATARDQGALSWELRAATSLAAFWRARHRHAEGRDILSGVLARFTEGFGTADLRLAKTLLNELERDAAD